MINNPFCIKQTQVLELDYSHRPKVDIQNDRLVISALLNEVETIITVPIGAAAPLANQIGNVQAKPSLPVVSKPIQQKPQFSRKQSYSFKTSVGKSRQGVLNAMAKLTEEDVRDIRQLLNDEKYMGQMKTKSRAYQDIAPLYNVSVSCIMLIDTNRTWKHVSI